MAGPEAVKFEIQREGRRVNRAEAGHRAATNELAPRRGFLVLDRVAAFPTKITATGVFTSVHRARSSVLARTARKMEQRAQGCVTRRADVPRTPHRPPPKLRAWKNKYSETAIKTFGLISNRTRDSRIPRLNGRARRGKNRKNREEGLSPARYPATLMEFLSRLRHRPIRRATFPQPRKIKRDAMAREKRCAGLARRVSRSFRFSKILPPRR